MPEPHGDPLDALRAPVVPTAPDPAFAARLGRRLRALLAATPEEQIMRSDLTDRPRNGLRHGDVSYITLGLPDLARGQAFYGSVLGWEYSPGSTEHSARVEGVAPMIGIWDGVEPGTDRRHGARLAYRVDDIEAAVGAVRAHGGTISDPHLEPYAMAAEGHDDQGLPFFLHEIPSDPTRQAGVALNGDVEGDISYLTMVVRDVDAAQAFYGGVFGWTFDAGRTGAQVGGVTPQMGITTRPEAGPTEPGVILCYRVDDIAAAVERVAAAGGRAGEVAGRPYGLEALCSDDQGTPFYLHQL